MFAFLNFPYFVILTLVWPFVSLFGHNYSLCYMYTYLAKSTLISHIYPLYDIFNLFSVIRFSLSNLLLVSYYSYALLTST